MNAATDKTKIGECSNAQEEQNYGKAVAAGFIGDSTEQEVEQLLGDRRCRLRMSKSNVQPNPSRMLF